MTILAQNGKIWIPQREDLATVRKRLNIPTRITFGVISLALYAFVTLEITKIIPGIAIESSYKMEPHKATFSSTYPNTLFLVLVASCVIVASVCFTVAVDSIDTQSIVMLTIMGLFVGGFFYANINYAPITRVNNDAIDQLYYQETGEHENINQTVSFNLDNKATLTTKDGSLYLLSAQYKNSKTVYSIKELETKK